ncbi:MAG: ABC transporter permease [Anaerolineae bacterium]|nr:ABC transporter permease [Anaerolineae bacterium]
MGASPLQAYRGMVFGAFGSTAKFTDTVMAWVPLALCSAGLLLTFTAGLWNIGIEGQIVVGAICTTWAARAWQEVLPAPVLLPTLLLAGMVGGALWGVLIGALKTYGKVHEIFVGLGLNFVAVATTNFLIFGPWRTPGRATMSGTELFARQAWLPTFPGQAVGPVELVLVFLSLAVVYVLLRGTRWGLSLKAMGGNLTAAHWLGIPVHRHTLIAFAGCGVFGGLAGAVQALGLFHRLIPSISSGYGYLAILVVMLAGYRAVWVAPVAFFFAAITKGSLQLPLEMQLDSALGGVLQGVLVLFVLLFQGLRARRGRMARSGG